MHSFLRHGVTQKTSPFLFFEELSQKLVVSTIFGLQNPEETCD